MLEIIIDIQVLFASLHNTHETKVNPGERRNSRVSVWNHEYVFNKNLDKIIQIFVYRVSLRVDFDNFVMVTFIVQVGILISLQTMVFPIVPSFNGASLIRWR